MQSWEAMPSPAKKKILINHVNESVSSRASMQLAPGARHKSLKIKVLENVFKKHIHLKLSCLLWANIFSSAVAEGLCSRAGDIEASK